MPRYLLLLCMLLTSALCFSACRLPHGGTEPPRPALPVQPDAPLVYLSLSESASYAKWVQGYEFRAGEGAYTADFHLSDAEEPYPVQTDQAWAETLTGFISQYGMMAWDGFSGHAPGLLDGTQFSMTFTFADGTSVHAGGYGRFPVNYRDATSAINAHFMQLLPQDLRTW